MKVTIILTTYNHERFLAQAFDGILSQKVDFDTEIVVAEDCSTDGTRDIVRAYQRNHGERIRPLFRSHNVGMNRNLISGIQASRGEYLALLEGDDRWTDPNKLQLQARFLDDNPGCVMCFHNVMVQADPPAGEPRAFCPPSLPPTLSVDDLLDRNVIPTCSMMFRNNVIGEMPAWYASLQLGDWPLCLLLARQGRVGYIDRILGVYRLHSGSAWSGRAPLYRYRETVRMLDCIDRHFEFCHAPRIRRVKRRLRRDLLRALLLAARRRIVSRRGVA